MIIIDAKNLIAGRLATQVAKKALHGEEIAIINADLAIIVGAKKTTLAKFKQRDDRGVPLRGPYIPKRPHFLLRRIIRGMLPYKKDNGRRAFENIKCYIGVPAAFEGKETVVLETAHRDTSRVYQHLTIGQISKFLGGSQ
ncbi:MAG: large subunit ribosomal protein L13 [Candidatus Woesearchaeota archaeon]|jgi:large subunit ribosomal protein L13